MKTFVKGWPRDTHIDDLPSFFPESTEAREYPFNDEEEPFLLNQHDHEQHHDNHGNINLDAFLIGDGNFAEMREVR